MTPYLRPRLWSSRLPSLFTSTIHLRSSGGHRLRPFLSAPLHPNLHTTPAKVFSCTALHKKELQVPPNIPPQIGARTLAPLITQSEIDRYLRPLYERGWCRSKTLGELKLKGSGTHLVPVSQIYREYRLRSFRAALKFVNAAAEIATAEKVGTGRRQIFPLVAHFSLKHHPRFIIDFNKVTIEVFTHTAKPPTVEGDQPISIPGITSRDLRLAALVDSYFESLGADDRVENGAGVDVDCLADDPKWPITVVDLHLPFDFVSGEKGKDEGL